MWVGGLGLQWTVSSFRLKVSGRGEGRFGIIHTMFFKQETLFPTEATSVVPELESLFVYHITHIDNLIPIFRDGFLRSDAWLRASVKTSGVSIAYDHIKDRRLANLIRR